MFKQQTQSRRTKISLTMASIMSSITVRGPRKKVTEKRVRGEPNCFFFAALLVRRRPSSSSVVAVSCFFLSYLLTFLYLDPSSSHLSKQTGPAHLVGRVPIWCVIRCSSTGIRLTTQSRNSNSNDCLLSPRFFFLFPRLQRVARFCSVTALFLSFSSPHPALLTKTTTTGRVSASPVASKTVRVESISEIVKM